MMPTTVEQINQIVDDTKVSKRTVDQLFTILKNDADGNCLFYSISQSLHGNQSKAGTYRKYVCDFYRTFDQDRTYPMDSLEEKIQLAMLGTEKTHAKIICKELKWAHYIDIIILAKLLNIKIIVFARNNELQSYSMGAFTTQTPKHIVYLHYNGRDHYEALIPKSVDTKRKRSTSRSKSPGSPTRKGTLSLKQNHTSKHTSPLARSKSPSLRKSNSPLDKFVHKKIHHVEFGNGTIESASGNKYEIKYNNGKHQHLVKQVVMNWATTGIIKIV